MFLHTYGPISLFGTGVTGSKTHIQWNRSSPIFQNPVSKRKEDNNDQMKTRNKKRKPFTLNGESCSRNNVSST